MAGPGSKLEKYHQIEKYMQNFSDQEIKFLIATNMMKKLPSIISTSQKKFSLGILEREIRRRVGYDVLSEQRLEMYQKHILQREARKGFQNYAHRFLLPFLKKNSSKHHYDIEDLNAESSLSAVAHTILKSNNVYLVHNANDKMAIEKPEDIDYLLGLFGENQVIIYPYGGHLGNLWFERNQKDYLKILFHSYPS